MARLTAMLVIAVAIVPVALGAEARTHTVKTILRDGRPVASADGVTVTPNGAPARHTIHAGERIADGTRVDVPDHLVVVVESSGGASAARLEPGSSLTFVATGSGEVVRSTGGKTFFDVVHKSLDFFRVQFPRSSH